MLSIFLPEGTQGLESKSEEGCQEAPLQKRFSTTDQSLLGVHSALHCQAEFVILLQRGLASLRASAGSLHISSLLWQKTEHLIFSNFKPTTSCSKMLKVTQKKVPVTLSYILTWEQGAQGLPSTDFKNI